VRSPLSLQKLVYLDGEQAGLYRSRMNPFLGRNFEAMDPLEWLQGQAPLRAKADPAFPLALTKLIGPTRLTLGLT
jgi:hypothetical protein